MIDKYTENSRRGMLNRAGKRVGYEDIAIHPAWRASAAFLADMGVRPPGTTLDRIDPRRGYEPGNCRWATPVEQRANRRKIPSGHHYYWTEEERLRLVAERDRGVSTEEIARSIGLSASRTRQLIREGRLSLGKTRQGSG